MESLYKNEYVNKNQTIVNNLNGSDLVRMEIVGLTRFQCSLNLQDYLIILCVNGQHFCFVFLL